MDGRRVVVSLLTEEQEFQRMQAADARAASVRAGLEVVVLFAENNPVVQIQQLFRFVHAAQEERPAAIVVESVVGEGLERVARNAVRAGIGWVLLNWKVAYLEGLRREHPGVIVASVAADEREIGHIQARQFRALLPNGGRALYVQGPPDTTTAQGRRDGLLEGLQGTAIEVKVLTGDWTETVAERAVAAWLRLKTSEGAHLALVGAQNDSMALGARRAIVAHQPEWARLPFTGCDGLPEGGQKLVAQGQLAATVVKPTTAGPAVELVARALRGLATPPEVILAPRSHPPEEALARRAQARA